MFFGSILVGEQNLVKIADFGLARKLDEELSYNTNNPNFPIKWTAPECFSTGHDTFTFTIKVLYSLILESTGSSKSEISEDIGCFS